MSEAIVEAFVAAWQSKAAPLYRDGKPSMASLEAKAFWHAYQNGRGPAWVPFDSNLTDAQKAGERCRDMQRREDLADELASALAELVARVDSAALEDGSSIDTLRAHAVLNEIEPGEWL